MTSNDIPGQPNSAGHDNGGGKHAANSSNQNPPTEAFEPITEQQNSGQYQPKQEFPGANDQQHPTQQFPGQQYPQMRSQPVEYQPVGYGQQGWQEPEEQKRSVVPLILLCLLMIGILVAAGWYFLSAIRSDEEPEVPVVTEYYTVPPAQDEPAPTSAEASEETPTTTRTTTSTRPTPTSASPTTSASRAIENVSSGVPGSQVTSNEFAQSVYSKYVELTDGKYVEHLELSAYSPITQTNYRMVCTGEVTKVVCRGGDNAVVVIR